MKRDRLKGKIPTSSTAWCFRGNHPVRSVGRGDVFRDLTEKGQGMAMNLIAGKKRDYTGGPILGTGAASRLSKPELANRIATILATRGQRNYEVV